MKYDWWTVRCALFAHKGGSFGIRELRQSDSNTTVREMKLGGTVVISLILCFVSRNKAQVSLISFHFFVFQCTSFWTKSTTNSGLWIRIFLNLATKILYTHRYTWEKFWFDTFVLVRSKELNQKRWVDTR